MSIPLFADNEAARQFMHRVREANIAVRIISDTRTYAAQNHLYRHGRFSHNQPKATNAHGGQSNYDFG